MVIILPIVFLALYAYQYKRTGEKFAGLAAALIWFQLALLIITNLLSVVYLLNPYTVFACWALVLMLVVILYVKKYGLAVPGREMFRYEKGFSVSGRIMLTGMGILFAILLAGALFTVPYNYDSMTYHLARVAHWMDNGSVNHYITNIDRQIYSPVLAEYDLLHVMLLTGSDTFVNLVQYATMIITALYLYKCTRMLGTNRGFSVLAAFLFVTMPLTVSQSITTQNDLAAAMWFAIFLYYLIQFVQTEKLTFGKQQREMLFYTGATVAFAFLLKTSVCASMLLFIPWLAVSRIRKKDSLIKVLQSAVLAGVSIVVLISETLIRTYLSCGSLMADTASADIMVATQNVSYILVNILKNFSLLITQHIFRPLNGFIYRIAISAGAELGVEVNNEAIAFHGFDFIRHMNMGDDMYSHDKTPSAFAAYMALLAGVFLVVFAVVSFIRYVRTAVNKRKTDIKADTAPANKPAVSQPVVNPSSVSLPEDRFSLGFAVSCWLSLGFIMALLRWQPWGTRLMYPALAMTVIMIGNALGYLCRRMKRQIWVLLPVACLSAVLCVSPTVYNMKQAVQNIEGGFSNRMERYFVFNKRYDEYQELLAYIRGAYIEDNAAGGEIGVIISGDGYDYPLWLIFKQEYPQVRLRQIVPDGDYVENNYPEYILYVEKERLEIGSEVEYKGVTYVCDYVCTGDYKDAVLVKAE